MLYNSYLRQRGAIGRVMGGDPVPQAPQYPKTTFQSNGQKNHNSVLVDFDRFTKVMVLFTINLKSCKRTVTCIPLPTDFASGFWHMSVSDYQRRRAYAPDRDIFTTLQSNGQKNHNSVLVDFDRFTKVMVLFTINLKSCKRTVTYTLADRFC
jgi:hypothetical protein